MAELTLEVTHPPYVMMSSDYSQQEPKISALVSQDSTLVDAFMHNRDAYATLASIALGFPYEECLEHNPVTGEVQPEGKARRSIGKVLNLGVTYGMSVQSISESLFSDREDMTEDEKLKQAQKIHDSLMKGFPGLAKAIANSQIKAAKLGYTETILGRRRHHPNMQLPRYEFVPMDGYVNPDIDPLDPESLKNKEQIPKRIVDALTKEFNSYKWYGKVVKRTKELAEQKIKVVNNSYKIEEASRQVFNCVSKDTEILTTSGWKKWNEVHKGDSILSYSVTHEKIEIDTVNDIYIYNDPTPVIDFESSSFSASSTGDHRWVVQDSREKPRFESTTAIFNNKRSDYYILRVADNNFEDCSMTDADLRSLAQRLLSDPDVSTDETTMRQAFNDVSKLSQRQAKLVMYSMLQANELNGESKETQVLIMPCKTKEIANVFQYLAFRAGFATNHYEFNLNQHDVELAKPRYCVEVLSINQVYIYPDEKSKRISEDGVWCVSTNNLTWVARRNGKVYITGNSIIQGSAADLTKMAMLKLENDPEWKEIGGRLVVPIHDELLCEVPLQNAEKGAEVLARCMCEAGSFFPFKLTCDVETSFRWYGIGIEDLFERDKPADLNWETMTPSNVEWIQCCLIENEFILPVFKEEDGSKPQGVRAKGANGKITDDLKQAVKDYMSRYNLQDDKSFLDHIEAKVVRGVY